MITELKPNQIFVFGSNLAGRHAAGAAFDAALLFGAVEGVGEGLTGQSYAFPTLDRNFKKISLNTLFSARDAFYRCANAHPDKEFLLTKVGCGIAGYDEQIMCDLFRDTPNNVTKPAGW